MADGHEDWQQQVEELLALQAIYQDEFRVVDADGIPDDVDLDPEQLLVLDPPSEPASLHCEAKVEVDLPDTAITLMVSLASKGYASSAENSAVPVGAPVQHLPPITVRTTLGPCYPSSQPPSVQLQAVWLSQQQVAQLEQQLHQLWEDQGAGFPICFTWLDWLKTEALPFLGISSTLVLSDPASSSSGVSSSAPSSSANSSKAASGVAAGLAADQVAGIIMRYAATQEVRAFQQATWQCGICYDDVPGTKCIRLPDCQHFYCTACMAQHCNTQINDGAVENLRCPQPDCRKHLPPYALQQLLSEEEYGRWESLLLQRTLDKMDDVVYCPRCNTICIEESGHMSQCSKCFFAYCTLCMDSFHPGVECLDPIQKLALLEKRKKASGAYDADRARRDLDQVNQLMSLKAINQHSKKCPACKMAIMKNEGCNKMTCTYCNTFFCWRCEEIIAGYDHFKGGCKLFEDEQVAAWNAMMAAQMGERQWEVEQGMMMMQLHAGRPGARGCRCPVCGQENIKADNNNLIRCWSCGNHFCFSCRTWLKQRAGQHFVGRNACKQHSAD